MLKGVSYRFGGKSVMKVMLDGTKLSVVDNEGVTAVEKIYAGMGKDIEILEPWVSTAFLVVLNFFI